MKLYTYSSFLSVIAALYFDHAMGTRLSRDRRFWWFHFFVVLLTTVVDNFISGLPVVIFNPDMLLGIRVINVPVENYLFGFGMITVNLVLYEYFRRRDHET